MKEFKGTQGVWSVDNDGDVISSAGEVVAMIGLVFPTEQELADANLIAAAPDLLKMLDELVSWHRHPDEVCGMGEDYRQKRIKKAEEIIDKALGEQP